MYILTFSYMYMYMTMYLSAYPIRSSFFSPPPPPMIIIQLSVEVPPPPAAMCPPPLDEAIPLQLYERCLAPPPPPPPQPTVQDGELAQNGEEEEVREWFRWPICWMSLVYIRLLLGGTDNCSNVQLDPGRR